MNTEALRFTVVQETRQGKQNTFDVLILKYKGVRVADMFLTENIKGAMKDVDEAEARYRKEGKI